MNPPRQHSLLSQQLAMFGHQLQDQYPMAEQPAYIKTQSQWIDTSTPRYAASGMTVDPAVSNNMEPPTNRLKRSLEMASAAPIMSRSASLGTPMRQPQSRPYSLSMGQGSRPSTMSQLQVPSTQVAWAKSTTVPTKYYVEKYISYEPGAYISNIEEPAYCGPAFKRPRQDTACSSSVMSSAPTSYIYGGHSSFNSSLTTASTAPSPLLCATSYQDIQWPCNDPPLGASMSRGLSTASSTGLSHSFQRMMQRSNSTASQALSSAEPSMFPLDDLSQPVSLSAELCQTSLESTDAGTFSFSQDNFTFDADGITDSNPLINTELVRDSFQPASAAMERTSSNGSTSSASERRQKQIENGIRQPIASKDLLEPGKTNRIKAEKQAIPKLPSKRPKEHTGLKCELCDEHPEGFHGAHELRRHCESKHAVENKVVWICQQAPNCGKPNRPLDNCKACTSGKQYNVYYNAAAHIRRAHFYPRQRGRRPRGEAPESRAGKAGGNDPPINELKSKGWIKPKIILVAKKESSQAAAELQAESSVDDEDAEREDDDHVTIDQTLHTDIHSADDVNEQMWLGDFAHEPFDMPDSELDGFVWDDTTMQESFIGSNFPLTPRCEPDEAFDSDLLPDSSFDFE